MHIALSPSWLCKVLARLKVSLKLSGDSKKSRQLNIEAQTLGVQPAGLNNAHEKQWCVSLAVDKSFLGHSYKTEAS